MLDTNQNEHPSQEKSPGPIVRPGITTEYLKANQIRSVTAQGASELVGCSSPGLILPYFQPTPEAHNPIYDPDGKPFCRLRKESSASGNKYHQPAGTSVHGYLPSNWNTGNNGETLIAVEGEFKALSLTDSNQGFSIPAFGLSGFYGFHLATDLDRADFRLVPELASAMDTLKPKRLAFLGDADTSFNWQFSHAAVRFNSLMLGKEVILPRLPINLPKGIDDCRSEFGSKFEVFFRRLLDDAIVLKVEDPDELALRLLEPQLGIVAKFPASEKLKLLEKVTKMGAQMGAEAREQLIGLAKKPLGVGTTELRKIISKRAAEVRSGLVQERISLIRPRVADYHYTGRTYFRKYGKEHVPLSGDENLLRALRNDAGLTGQVTGADSDAELGIFLVQKENGIRWAGEVAGRPAGILSRSGSRILITRGPTIIQGSLTGDASFIIELLLDFFGRSEGDARFSTQFSVFCGWLKQARKALMNPDDNLAGQALALVGAADVGKTFLPQQLIAPSLGGRYVECADFFTGKTNFNSALIGSELLHLSDFDTGPDEESRRIFRNLLKRVVANPTHMLQKKYADQLSVEPIWRLVISLNRESTDVQALPRLDSSVRDKISVFACYRPPCLPGDDPAERQAFRAKIHAALPVFLGQIDGTPIHEKLRDGRFGVVAWHHPEVLRLMCEADPVALLSTFLDEYLADLRPEYDVLSAHEWFNALAGKFGPRFTTLVPGDQELGRLLASLRDFVPEWTKRIEKIGKEPYGSQRNYRTTWKISKRIVGS